MQSDIPIHPQCMVGPEQAKNMLTCPICFMLLRVPLYRCEECGNHFCKDCMDSWWVSSKKEREKDCVYNCSQSCLTESDYESFRKHRKICEFQTCRCSNPGCEQLLLLKNLSKHDQQCAFKMLSCRHCSEAVPRSKHQQHQQQLCDLRKVVCPNEGCGLSLACINYIPHRDNCPYIKAQCPGCKIIIHKKDMSAHEEVCPQIPMVCPGCNKQYPRSEIELHLSQCQQVIVTCDMCDYRFTKRKFKEHSIQECMIKTIKELKKDNEKFHDQNLKLKLGMERLLEIIEKMSSERGKNIEDSVIEKMRKQEQSVIEKDLQRIQYSLRSIEKLRKEEMDAHLKYPHLIESWCFFCGNIEKKYQKMMEPLLEKKKEYNLKLGEFARYNQTRRE